MPAGNAGDSNETALAKGEEGGDDVKSSWPLYAQGSKRPTMADTEGCQTVRWSKSQKVGPSSDCGLKFARMKLESLVIADQHAAVNMFLSLVHTARQATKAGNTRSRSPNPREGAAEGRIGDWD